MRAFFNAFTTLSLRFRAITLLLVVIVMIFGGVAVTQLNQELLPPIEFPQTIILAQVSGMSSDQVLNVVTSRLEAALDQVEAIANLETTTTGAFGAVIIARNEFGVNQDRLLEEIRSVVESVWLPVRRIAPSEGETGEAFATRLVNELTPDMLIYLAEQDSNFLFQLSPEVWAALPDETVRTVSGYLADQTATSGSNALQSLVEQEIVPQLERLDLVSSVDVSGGQALPGDESGTQSEEAENASAESLLLQLSPDVWEIVSAKAGVGALDETAVQTLSEVDYTLPETAPALPTSWQMDRFTDTSDLLEIRSLTTTTAGILNNFIETGEIVGPLGQTNDLTPADVQQLLEIDPSLVEYLEADQLAALSPDVFAVLPEEYIDNLDGFTRDALAAAALAESVTGETATREPVALPSAWRISPPQIITFSLDQLPLATFSVSTVGDAPVTAPETDTDGTETDESEETADDAAADADVDATSVNQEIPEGPSLPFLFSALGGFLGIELNTADDLINVQLPEEQAAQFGASTLRAADLLNFMLLLGDPESLPEGVEMPAVPINPAALISGFSPEAVAFIAEYDPTFLPNLSAEVYNTFSDEVLAQPQIAPPLADVWNTLADQPQFANTTLQTAADLLSIGDGSAASVLNTINASVPERFAGYEVRLFDSLSPATLRYLSLQETDFYETVDPEVLKKFSPAAITVIPEDVLASLDPADAEQLTAIASGEQNSAFADLQELYATDVPPADPNAPALNADWQFIGDFIGVELDTADDFTRFFPDTATFINNIFDSPQGSSFAPTLLGGLSQEALDYMVAQSPNLLTDLRTEALQLLSPDVLTSLPQDIQNRAVSGEGAFVPTNTVTRANGEPSLTLTVNKVTGANTVNAYHDVEEAMQEIQERDPNLQVSVVFEQASFIEESINGVAREGTLGALFAMIVILIFLSVGHWGRPSRRITGIVLLVMSAVMLGLLLSNEAATHGVSIGEVFNDLGENALIATVLLSLGMIVGLLIAVAPVTLPYPAWRPTLVIGVSIPLSVLAAMALMRWFSPAMHKLLEPGVESSSLIAFLIRLFPENLTLNIMTLSGLTVAIGRVVDDSIVVLENIFRQMQTGMSKREAILSGTRDVSVAIFVATLVTVIVFLPLGLTGGIIGEFFLPFGLAVTYSLAASFVVAITVVPILVYLFIPQSDELEAESGLLERIYEPTLRWALRNNATKWIVIFAAVITALFGFVLFAGRPAAFLPSFGEPQIAVTLNLPTGTSLVETNEVALQIEEQARNIIPSDELRNIQAVVGGGGQSLQSVLGAGGGVTENAASITVGLRTSEDNLDQYAQELREAAAAIAGSESVSVSAASLSEQGFGGFAVVLSGPQESLEAVNQQVIDTIEAVDGIANVTSNLTTVAAAGADGPETIIRIDGETAVRYTGELETENTLGVTQDAITAVNAIPNLPADLTVSQGFETETQTEGFASLFVAMGIAIFLMIIILIFTFGSPVYWLAIIFSIVVAPVGAAIALTLTDRVLGISAMIGLLMLIGIVVTNAVVLIDRAHTNDVKLKMPVKNALMEAGERRLRPIVMTALATIMALLPLAIGLSRGAIIAAELGTVVIGGLFSSTLLTLLVVPVAYNLFHPLHNAVMRALGRGRSDTGAARQPQSGD
jgi:multidrug efflux pump subunit AcrB